MHLKMSNKLITCQILYILTFGSLDNVLKVASKSLLTKVMLQNVTLNKVTF